MAELVDALDLGSSVARREGSSPFRRTTHNNPGCLKHQSGFFCAYKIANISPTEFIANLFRLLKVYDVLLHIFYDFIALHLASLILRAGTRLPIVSEIKK